MIILAASLVVASLVWLVLKLRRGYWLFGLALILLLPIAVRADDDGHEVVISSFPDGAHVLVDSVDTGKLTPMELRNISPGVHVITVSTNAPGWNSDTRTVTILGKDVAGKPRDTHLSFNLIPTVTNGLPGVQGPIGVTPVLTIGYVGIGAWPNATLTGTTSQPILNFTLPLGIPGYTPIKGIDYFDGKDSIVPGPQGATGIGIPGAPGQNFYAGIYSKTGVYQTAQAVLRDASVGGTRGPFFLIGQNAGVDPVLDTANWVSAIPNPVLGYMPFISSGPIAGTFNASSIAPPLISYTFNVYEQQSFSRLNIAVTFQQSGGGTTVQTTSGTCTVDFDQAEAAGIAPTCSGLPFVSRNGGSVSYNGGIITFTAYDISGGSHWESFSWVLSIAVTTQPSPIGVMNFTLLKNAIATPLTISTGATGTYSIIDPNGSNIFFGPGDTLTLQIQNPSTSTDVISSGSWTLQ